MRDEHSKDSIDNEASDDDFNEKRKSSRRKFRNGSGFGRGDGGGPFGGFGGFGGGGGGGFNPGQFMQMLPLIMAMSGGMPGGNMARMQLQIMMWMIETWLDYLSAMQQVLERALGRLRDMDLCGGLMGGGDQDEDDQEW